MPVARYAARLFDVDVRPRLSKYVSKCLTHTQGVDVATKRKTDFGIRASSGLNQGLGSRGQSEKAMLPPELCVMRSYVRTLPEVFMKRPAYPPTLITGFLLLSVLVVSCQAPVHSPAVRRPTRNTSKTVHSVRDRRLPANERAAYLYLAVITEDLTTIRNLSRDRAVLGVPVAGDWPLFAAARLGRPDIMDELLNAGADPRVRNALGESLLHAAAWGGNPRCIDRAIKAGIATNARDRWGHTPLFVALRRGRASAARMLMKAGARLQDVRDGSSGPIDVAVRSGDTKTVELVLLKSAISGVPSPSAVFTAVETGHAEVLQELLSRGFPAAGQDRWLRTPLHAAASSGNVAAAKLLIRSGANASTRDSAGMTPLHRACEDLHPEVAAVLLDAGANPKTKTKQGADPLYIVLEMGADTWWRQQERGMQVSGDPVTRLVRILLRHGAHPRARDLVLAAHQGLPFDLLRRMYDPQYVRTGAISTALDAVLTRGCTYLEEMPDTVERALEKEKLLLDLAVSCYRAGNSPDVVDRVLNTSVTHATRAGATWWLEWAVRASDATLVRVLSRHVRPGRMLDSPAEKTLLHVAARFSSGRVVTLLLKAGARQDVVDAAQHTALHTAAAYGNTDALSVLLRSGLLPLLDRTDDRGMTALMYAARGGHTDAVRILLKAGARTDVRDRSGFTALDHALMQGKTAAVMELVKADPSMKSGRHGTTSTLVWLVLNPDQTPLLRWGAWYNILKSLNKIASIRRRFSDSLALWDAGAMMAAGDPWSRVASVVLSSLPAPRRILEAGRAAERMTWLGLDSVALKLINAGGSPTGAARAAVFLGNRNLLKHMLPYHPEVSHMLEAAVISGNRTMLDNLITTNDELQMALIDAVRARKYDMVTFLIGRRASTNMGSGSLLPLSVAGLAGDMKMVNLLLSKGALPVLQVYHNPLEQMAVLGNGMALVRLFDATRHIARSSGVYCKRIRRHLPRILAKTWLYSGSAQAVSASFRAAAICPGTSVLKSLLTSRMSFVNATFKPSKKPLYADLIEKMPSYVRQDVILEFVKGLDRLDISPVSRNTVIEMTVRGWVSPLRYLSERHRAEMLRIMRRMIRIRFPLDDLKKVTLLHAAAYHGNPDMVRLLLSMGLKPLVNVRDEAGRTPLMLALEKGHFRAAAALLRAGAVWKPLDRKSLGPLHAAAWWCDAKATAEFLRLGIGPNVYDAWGQTPLHIAARRGCVTVVKKLLAAGAVLSFDKKRKTSAGVIHGGCSPAGYAAALGRRAVLDLLRKKAQARTHGPVFTPCL